VPGEAITPFRGEIILAANSRPEQIRAVTGTVSRLVRADAPHPLAVFPSEYSLWWRAKEAEHFSSPQEIGYRIRPI
jgi:hypothetical protein